MVCLGNICRSPMADGLLRKKVKENNRVAPINNVPKISCFAFIIFVLKLYCKFPSCIF